MARLDIAIDPIKKFASFSGLGTFEAKEEIKKLGRARWNSIKKSWDVVELSVNRAQLSELFPDSNIIEIASDEGDVSATIESPSADSGAVLPASYTVSQFIFRARDALKQAFPAATFVCGKISSVKDSSGRLFIELSDLEREDERISCVIWRDADKLCEPLIKLGFKLENNLQVMFKVLVEVNKRDARISLNILGVVSEYTIAKLQALREQTNQKLKSEGLFGKNKELSLPFLPKRLGILTSGGGTVINDFMSGLEEANFGYELFWVKVNVQGENAAKKVRAGLKQLLMSKDLDAILIFRGGGSPAELGVFNDYDLARDICNCHLPVFSAIGHQEDQCSVQDVSFCSFGVPKDLGHFFAELANNLRRELKQSVRIILQASEAQLLMLTQKINMFSDGLRQRIAALLLQKKSEIEYLLVLLPTLTANLLKQKKLQMEAVLGTIKTCSLGLCKLRTSSLQLITTGAHAAFRSRLENISTVFEQNVAEVFRESEKMLSLMSERLNNFQLAVTNLSPEAQLKRGFAMIKKATTEQVITRGKNLKTNDAVRIIFYDTEKTAVIDK
ncbi:MAG: exodeoxyribonuclease VII large subunit [Deltaproteobacteria bacterium]|nr:exodeoxyribonuclease VII large subunit [Deltaproteobacteria bacterium]